MDWHHINTGKSGRFQRKATDKTPITAIAFKVVFSTNKAFDPVAPDFGLVVEWGGVRLVKRLENWLVEWLGEVLSEGVVEVVVEVLVVGLSVVVAVVAVELVLALVERADQLSIDDAELAVYYQDHC